MKVLMFSNDPNILVDGAQAQRRMIRYAELCDELHLVVLTATPSPDRVLGNLFAYAAPSRSALMQRLYAWSVARRLCKAKAFDLMSVQAPDELGLIGYLLSRHFRIPLQLQVHTDVFSPWYTKGSPVSWVRNRIARFLLARVDCLRVVSERIKRSIVTLRVRNQESGIAVLPIYTDVAAFLAAQANPATEARFRGYELRMVAAGRFVEKEKNFLLLIEVMRELVRTCPRALLVIVGEGRARKHYASRIRNYGLENNVMIEPWRNDLPSFYQSFDLFLLSSNYEGWGRVVIEAMAAGLCVVMTDVGLAGEVVRSGENGMMVPVADRRAFLAALADLCNTPEKRRRLAAAGRATVRRLRPRTEAEYLMLYKEALAACTVR